ncbi:MAG: hypothetical protein ACRCT1_05270 [Microcoleaceae cyanobacterium]
MISFLLPSFIGFSEGIGKSYFFYITTRSDSLLKSPIASRRSDSPTQGASPLR